jgi:acyl transferase domain-containing protein
VVVAGSEILVESVVNEVGMMGHRLAVSHAFHSPLMDPMMEAYRRVVEAVGLSANQVPVLTFINLPQ